MGCNSSKIIKDLDDTGAGPNRTKRSPSPSRFRASVMMKRGPDGQAARLYQKHRKQEERLLGANGRLGQAKADTSITFDRLAERGVIDRDALKRASYMPK